MPSKYNKEATKSNFGRLSDFRESTDSSLEKVENLWYDYPFTIICSIFLVVIHFLFWILAPTDILFTLPNQFLDQFSLYNPFVINDFFNNWYRLFTSLFIHADIFHLAGNLLFFVIFSIRLEELKGTKVVAVVFLISGLAGNILTLLIFWTAPLLSLGASGAINGVFMANVVTMRKTYDKGSLTMLAFIVIFASFTIAGQSSNFFAHFGGLLGGGLAMYGFERLEKKRRKRNH